MALTLRDGGGGQNFDLSARPDPSDTQTQFFELVYLEIIL